MRGLRTRHPYRSKRVCRLAAPIVFVAGVAGPLHPACRIHVRCLPRLTAPMRVVCCSLRARHWRSQFQPTRAWFSRLVFGSRREVHRSWGFAAFRGRLHLELFGFQKFCHLVCTCVLWSALTARYCPEQAGIEIDLPFTEEGCSNPFGSCCALYCGEHYLDTVGKRLEQ